MRRPALLLTAALLATTAPLVHAARPAGAATYAARRAAWLAEYTRLAARLPLDPAVVALAPPVAPPPPPDLPGLPGGRPGFAVDDAVLVKAGDLDGDGAEDVADLREHITYDEASGFTQTLRIEARRGRDAKLLWSLAPVSATTCYAYPVFTTVGAAGKAGVLIASYDCRAADTPLASSVAMTLTLTAYDGTGTKVWDQRFAGGGAGAIAGYGGTVPVIDGLFDANKGGGLDVLVETYVSAGAADPSYERETSAARLRLNVVDGATGARRDVGVLLASDRDDLWVYPVGDLDKDGRADVVAVHSDAADVVADAVASADGAALWRVKVGSTESIGSGGEVTLVALPDVTGDGAAEVGLLTGGGWYTAKPGGSVPTGRVMLVDGGRGRAAWTRPGTTIDAIGDADRRRGSEVVVGVPLESGTWRGFTAAAYTGSGRRVWSVTRRVSVKGFDRYELNSGWGPVGDVRPDGVLDIGYVLTAEPVGDRGRRDEGTIDGRTGRVRRDPVRDMIGTPLAFDGRGADAYTREVSGGLLTVGAWRGDTGARLWRVAVAANGGTRRTFGISADRDRCADLLVGTGDGSTAVDYLFSGATGRPLWGLRRAGDGAASVFRPAVRRHTRYQRTC